MKISAARYLNVKQRKRWLKRARLHECGRGNRLSSWCMLLLVSTNVRNAAVG